MSVELIQINKSQHFINPILSKVREFKIKIIRPSRELAFALDFSKTAIMDSFTHGFQQAGKAISIPDWDTKY